MHVTVGLRWCGPEDLAGRVKRAGRADRASVVCRGGGEIVREADPGPGGGGRQQREILSKLMENTPVLARDDTLRRILLNWGSWIGGGPDPDGVRSGAFWGL